MYRANIYIITNQNRELYSVRPQHFQHGRPDYENFIYVKKLLFLRTIIFRDENCIYKKILKLRADSFTRNIRQGIRNLYDSPIYDFLRVSIMYHNDLHDEVMRMIYGTRIYSHTRQVSCF